MFKIVEPYEIYRTLRIVRKELLDRGANRVTSTDVMVLCLVQEKPRDIADLCRLTDTTFTQMTKCVNKLVKLGVIVRKENAIVDKARGRAQYSYLANYD